MFDVMCDRETFKKESKETSGPMWKLLETVRTPWTFHITSSELLSLTVRIMYAPCGLKGGTKPWCLCLAWGSLEPRHLLGSYHIPSLAFCRWIWIWSWVAIKIQPSDLWGLTLFDGVVASPKLCSTRCCSAKFLKRWWYFLQNPSSYILASLH